MSARNKARRRRRVLRLLRTALVCLIALAVALLFSIVPYRSFLPAAQIAAHGEGEMRLHFLSVGQGDCTIVEFRAGMCSSWTRATARLRQITRSFPT